MRSIRTLPASITALVLVSCTLLATTGPAGAAGAERRDYEALWDAATLEERTAAGDLIVETAEATEAWRDVDAALAAGFAPNRVGNGPVHYRNVTNRRDDRVLDPERPEALVYLHRGDAPPILLGAVYVARRDQPRPLDAGALTTWHVHHDPVCHHPDVTPGCDGVLGGMLHVWVYDGVVDPFADPMFASMGDRSAWRAKLTELAATTG